MGVWKETSDIKWFNAFLEAPSEYCLLTCMFYSRDTNNVMTQLRVKALALVYNDCELSLEDLLEKKQHYPVLVQCHISIPPENIRQPKVF